MRIPSRRRSLIVVVTFLAVVAFANVAFSRHAWRKYHWARTSNPVTIKLGNNLNSTWSSYLSAASSDWSQSSVIDTTVVAGQSSPATCPPTSGRVEVCNANYGSTGWLGIASIWASGFHITQGTVKNNDYYFNQARYNTPAWRQFVTCQEVGHTFGLDHQDENFNNTNLGTCMDYTNDPTGTAGTNGSLNNLHPNQHDYEQLASIYSHLDTTTTAGQSTNGMPAAANQAALDGPGQWGREIHRSADGRKSIYELDFGGNNKIFTFVFWADPEDVPHGEHH